MSDLEGQAKWGLQAERLLSDEVFKGAVASVERKYLEQWRKSLPDEGLKREKAYLLLRSLGEVINEIRIVIDGGTVAQANLQRSQRKG
jgi:hypothetical protein